MSVNTENKIIAEYVWIGGNGELRSKARTLVNSKLPEWNYDGSSTNQASGHNSEVILKPCAIFNDPFRGQKNTKLVLCDTYLPNDDPHPTNTRYHANKLFNNVYIRTIIKDATDDIIEGKDFLYKIKQAKVFPEIFIQLLSSGFQSGSLLEMFEKLAFYFKDEIDNSRSSLLSIIEPLILIIMGGIITLIILAILLPIMQMNNSFLS